MPLSRSRSTSAYLRSTLLFSGLVAAAACGARSELYVGGPIEQGGGGQGAVSASVSVATTGGGGEGGLGAGGMGGEGGAIPPPPECDPDALFIYLVSSERELYRFDPSTLTLNLRGTLACPAADGAGPFSMGVSRDGVAYVLYNSGELFNVDVVTANCFPTDFEVGQAGFDRFGMGFALDGSETGESLYVAEINFNGPSAGLGRIDPLTLDLTYLGPFSENPGNAVELTSADDGELYGYFLAPQNSGGVLVRIDKDTAEILDAVPLAAGSGGSALAFAYWGGDFYVFTGTGNESTVTRYRPEDGTETVITTLPTSIVGAGVSTCTPSGN